MNYKVVVEQEALFGLLKKKDEFIIKANSEKEVFKKLNAEFFGSWLYTIIRVSNPESQGEAKSK